MTNTALCRCTGDCGLHAKGERCGKPVENPLDAQEVSGGIPGEWFKIGICEECWKHIQAKKKL